MSSLLSSTSSLSDRNCERKYFKYVIDQLRLVQPAENLVMVELVEFCVVVVVVVFFKNYCFFLKHDLHA